MTDPTTLYDFRLPGRLPDHVDALLERWRINMCAQLPEQLAQHLQSPPSVTAQTCDQTSAAEGLTSLPATCVGAIMSVGSPCWPSLFVMSRLTIIALLLDMLGDPVQEPPEDRALSMVETSLCELLFREFAGAIASAWPGQGALHCELDQLEHRPERSRLFKPETRVIAATFELSGSFGVERAVWFVPQEPFTQLVSAELALRGSRSQHARILIEARTREIPIDMVVPLGASRVNISQLVGLKPGDLLVLDQKICEPLRAMIGKTTLFAGWPGRVGGRQAIKIAMLVEESDS